MKKALVIFSGGQDSTTCLLYALHKFDEVECITFDYGQRHGPLEIQAAMKICEHFNIQQNIVDVTFFGMMSNSKLTNPGNINEIVNGLPASFVPNRNQLFITIAHAYAQKIHAQTIITGVCQTDYSGYPDCRQQFINAIAAASNLGSDSRITIETPLMNMSKSETFMLAEKYDGLDIVLNMSHTCYNGSTNKNEWGYGCGECPACQLRSKGFAAYMEAKRIQRNRGTSVNLGGLPEGTAR